MRKALLVATVALGLWVTAAHGQEYYKAVASAIVNGIGTTSTDGVALLNTTPATVGATVQLSPRVRMCGTAWNSVGAVSETNCFFLEALPVTAAGTTSATLRFGYINPAGAITYPATLTSPGTLTLGQNLVAGTIDLNVLSFNAATRSRLLTAADKLLSITDSQQATGMEINDGSATLGTCTGGTITTGSHNFGGGYTGNTSGSCVVNFGTPAWTNAPFCVAMSIASTTHPRVSAVATTSITITGGVSGEAITYHCVGRIGT